MMASKRSARVAAYSPEGSPSPRVENVMTIHRSVPPKSGRGTGTVYSTRNEGRSSSPRGVATRSTREAGAPSRARSSPGLPPPARS